MKECNDFDGPCDLPKEMPMNCGVDTGVPFHEEEYLKVIKKEN